MCPQVQADKREILWTCSARAKRIDIQCFRAKWKILRRHDDVAGTDRRFFIPRTNTLHPFQPFALYIVCQFLFPSAKSPYYRHKRVDPIQQITVILAAFCLLLLSSRPSRKICFLPLKCKGSSWGWENMREQRRQPPGNFLIGSQVSIQHVENRCSRVFQRQFSNSAIICLEPLHSSPQS